MLKHWKIRYDFREKKSFNYCESFVQKGKSSLPERGICSLPRSCACMIWTWQIFGTSKFQTSGELYLLTTRSARSRGQGAEARIAVNPVTSLLKLLFVSKILLSPSSRLFTMIRTIHSNPCQVEPIKASSPPAVL